MITRASEGRVPVAIAKKAGPNLFALTSPPAKPEPAPDDASIARIVTFADRAILIQYPRPDSMTLVAPLAPDMQSVPVQSSKGALAKAKEFDFDLRDHLNSLPLPSDGAIHLAKLSPSQKLPEDITKAARVVIELGPAASASISLNRKELEGFPSWSIRLELSVIKAGEAGLKAIEEGFEVAFGALLDFGAILPALKVAQLDVATDCIGAEPLDFLYRIPKPGKRVVYYGDHGRPETMYFHEKKDTPSKGNTLGPTRLRVYERRAEALQRGFEPPFGRCPVTRLEIPTRWTANRPSLRQLPEIKNRLRGRFVGYAAGQKATDPESWREYVLQRLSAGPAPISKAISKTISFAKLFKEFDADILSPADWDGWERGLGLTGLDRWVDRAKQ